MLLRKRFMDNVLKVQRSWATRRKFLLISGKQIAEIAGMRPSRYSRAEKKGTDSISEMIAIEKAFAHFESALSKDYKNALRRQNYLKLVEEKKRLLQEGRQRDEAKLRQALAEMEQTKSPG